MMNENIIIKGAKEHNLKNVNLKIPRDKLVVLTGLSGSGKSSLAFDTIYAEGQRRYMESLSSYARQFLGQMNKPNVESIEGLSPSISIDQKTTSKNPRSTVGTVTEIYDYLRLLYARIGTPHCPICGREITNQSIDQIVDKIIDLGENTKIQVLAPIASGKKGEYTKEFENAKKNGFVRVRVDGEIHDLSETIKLNKNQKHSIEIIVDRIVINKNSRSRITDAVETAAGVANGIIIININMEKDIMFSKNFACPEHNIAIGELTPRMFSFNSPFGACKKCTGLGVFMEIDPNLIIPDNSKSINQGGVKGSGWSMEGNSIAYMYYKALAKKYKFSLDTPLCDLPKEILDIILYGTKGEMLELVRETSYGKTMYKNKFEGIIPNLERRFKETKSSWIKQEIESFMNEIPCDECGGNRLSPISLGVTVGEKNISELCQMSVIKILDFLSSLKLNSKNKTIAGPILKEIKNRLMFLKNVGLEYLTLSRSSGTLSGGESQRIRLATQIGSALMGVLYVLDEPSIGLHQRDNQKLLGALKNLRDAGNSVIVVEHDEETMYAADYIVDVGPGSGINGGEIVCTGTVDDIKKCKNSITGQYLSGKKTIEIPKTRRKGTGKFLEIIEAAENNLKNINVKIPLGTITGVTGVSGSGKSSLVNEIIYKKLSTLLNKAKNIPGKHKKILGTENLDKVIDISQSPIGRTPRSNPATYTGVFTDIRDLFASTNDSKAKGFSSGRFSFNVKGGRCESCQGDGIIKIEMHFLSDIYIPCEVCKGKRYNQETLSIKYKNKNISDILNMTVDEACNFFENHPKIKRKLSTLQEVGLGYITLGQPATTLSGGEAQRVKLATELSKKSTGKTLYILDEPTTGLHIADVHRLTQVLQKLVKSGNTIILIEHNLDMIKICDHLIDLGPEGGENGGEIIAEGTPEEIAKNPKSYTGIYLKKMGI
ncbi:MAG: excinuclease ABC subunit UvrA [Clostridia bacterium]|nr:excinuclease ABC subunit UvrA [Clostridia bacterium]